MDFITNLKIAENSLVHNKKHTVYECADHVSRSHNYLCRISSLTEDLSFPIELAVPLMKFQGNYELMKLICWECGFAPVKMPKGKMPKGEENKLVSEYQRVVTKAITMLLEYLADPDKANFNKAMAAIENAVEQNLSVRKYIEKKNSKQQELDL